MSILQNAITYVKSKFQEPPDREDDPTFNGTRESALAYVKNVASLPDGHRLSEKVEAVHREYFLYLAMDLGVPATVAVPLHTICTVHEMYQDLWAYLELGPTVGPGAPEPLPTLPEIRF